MQIEIGQSESIHGGAGAIAGILHDLCQPLTALECSLELALLPRSPAEVRTLTTAALGAARWLHTLANRVQAIESLCRQYRSPRVTSLSQLAAPFNLDARRADFQKKLYIDIEGLTAVFHRVCGAAPLRGTITCVGLVIRIVLALDLADRAQRRAENIPENDTLTAALVEHLGGRMTHSGGVTVIEFPAH